ncbi:MAG: U32 family peptidase [Lachnospiraceae bacterium]|nr:U32 family peptidase [Lachnospiraceae bacterium]
MNRKVELLAPAGNYEAFLGAVNAGADAVYLGGNKFGARAYADNFSEEEICHAIHTAHFMGRKIYLTVNTLVKEHEFTELYDYLLPLYEAGLDGVIVQDIGVLCYIREHFKGLSLHASTQMTLTGAGGASILKEQGVERIVPARELSLAEVCSIKEKTGLEIECFIHGAMCYCYSGQCLFSSILGGRSGNRGRCAQPCRLPYQIYEGAEKIKSADYPLSLKDMCTISYIPQLIEAGIDSFKIEGRMKKPEYAAGVTAIYRKYIDLYEMKGTDAYHVEEGDIRKLQSLYIRSELQNGYYERHNGREMITLHKPSYAGSDKFLLEQIRADYVREPDKPSVKMQVELKVGEPIYLCVTGESVDTVYKDKSDISVTVYGNIVEQAQKMPLQQEKIRKQMLKTGNSCVTVSACDIVMDDKVFLPVSALNDLRRKGIEAYEQQYIMRRGLTAHRQHSERQVGQTTESIRHDAGSLNATDIFISTYSQLTESVNNICRRIYIDSDLYLMQYEKIAACMEENTHIEYYLALPYVLRARDENYLHVLKNRVLNHTAVRGFLVRNLEEFSYVRTFGEGYALVPDAGLYCYNAETIRFWAHYCDEYTLPYELNRKEAEKLAGLAGAIGMSTSMIVYSRIPMMISANCIKKTAGRCMPKSSFKRKKGTGAEQTLMLDERTVMYLKDRYGTDFPVEINCNHCYNIIYNSVPYSLHLQPDEVNKIGADIRRYDFTTETAEECRQILEGGRFPYDAYTTGHLKRGVE